MLVAFTELGKCRPNKRENEREQGRDENLVIVARWFDFFASPSLPPLLATSPPRYAIKTTMSDRPHLEAVHTLRPAGRNAAGFVDNKQPVRTLLRRRFLIGPFGSNGAVTW